jgi:hypothetical protein
MKPAFLDSKDFWAGVMFLATGLAAMFIARRYAFGTTLRMGPGYFPSALGGLLVLFGLWFVAKGLRSGERIEGGWSARALIVLPLSLVLFGLLVERAGFVPALAVLIFGSAAAGTQFRLVEVALLTVALTALCVAVFIWGLGLPYPLLAGF